MTPTGKQDGKFDWKWWITTGVVVVGMIVAAAWQIKEELSKIDKHISRVETAVRLIGAKQGADTKALVDEALTVAQNAANSGHTDSAVAALVATNNLLTEEPLRTDQSSTRDIGLKVLKLTAHAAPPLSNAAWKVTNSVLTSYSAVLPPPPSHEYRVHFSSTTLATECIGVEQAQHWVFQDFMFENCTAHIDSLFGPNAMARGVFISNGVFKNVRVVYSGGPLRLAGIYFEGCTFDLEPKKGSELLAQQLLTQTSPFDLYVPPSTQ